MKNDFIKILNDYLYFLEFKKNKRMNTITSVKNDLLKFINYLEIMKIENLDSIFFDTLKDYIYFLETNNFKINSIKRKISSIKNFLKYLQSKNIIKNNFSIALNIFDKSDNCPTYLKEEEIEKIRTMFYNKKFNTLRNKLMFELMYSSGISPQDLLMLGTINFNLEERSIYFLKNKEKNILYFSNRALEAYIEYMNIKKNKLQKYDRKADIDTVLFVTSRNERLSDRTLRKIFQKIFLEVGLDDISLYSIRHTFCIHMLKFGFNKSYLKKLLNLKNDELIEVYEKIIKRSINE